jgi:hypothetical protein
MQNNSHGDQRPKFIKIRRGKKAKKYFIVHILISLKEGEVIYFDQSYL